MSGKHPKDNHEQMELPGLFVSVIVPVFNDAKRLKTCLEALETQTYPQSLYEVIVVDNGSDEAEDIKGVVAQFGQAIAAFESFPSSFAARNQGIALAKGDIIAFTDADCIPATDWLEKGVHYLLSTPNCGLVAGKVEVFFRDSQQATAVELYESITAFPQQELIEKHRYAATANLFTWKKAIEHVGLFDATLKSSGDIEWGKRVYAYGYQQVYADDVCVAHPARYSLNQLYKRTVRLAGGVYDLYNRKCYSFLERNQKYTVELLKSLVPPVNFVLYVFFKSPITELKQKLQVSLVMFLVRYVSAGEMFKLKLGGSSTRD